MRVSLYSSLMMHQNYLLTLTLALLYSSSNPGFRMHHSFVQLFKVPLTFNQSANTITDGSLSELSSSFATLFFSRQ